MESIMVGGYHCTSDSLHPVFHAGRLSLAESLSSYARLASIGSVDADPYRSPFCRQIFCHDGRSGATCPSARFLFVQYESGNWFDYPSLTHLGA